MGRIKTIPTVEELKEKLSPLFREEGLSLVLLFGSAATARVRGGSDIDLAFLYDRPIDVLALTNRVIRLLRSDHVDVVDLRRASPLLKFSSVKGGRVLYEKGPGVFSSFYSLAFRMYADSKKLRDAKARSIALFLEARGLR